MILTAKLIYSDLYRKIGKNKFFFIKALMLFIYSSSVRFLIYFRLASSSFFLFKLCGYIFYYVSPSRKRIQIPIGTKIGFGFYIGHEGYIIINKNSIIGNNCNISQFCTIGSTTNFSPTVGDNVYIGPNSCLVGNIKIGDNVVIGAGSIVTKNIPSNCTAVGNYAKVINDHTSEQIIKNRFMEVN